MSGINHRDVMKLHTYFNNRIDQIGSEIKAIEMLYEKNNKGYYLMRLKSLAQEKTFVEKMIGKMDYELKNTIGVLY